MPRKTMTSIEDRDRYEAMRREGMSKENAARSANTPAALAGTRGGKAPDYEDLTKDQLYDRARRIGIRGSLAHDEGTADLRIAPPLTEGGSPLARRSAGDNTGTRLQGDNGR